MRGEMMGVHSGKLIAFIVMLITGLLVGASIEVMAAPRSSGAEGETLSDYIGAEFKAYPIARLESLESVPEGVIKLDEVKDRLANILYLVSSDPFSIVVNLTHIGKARYLGENFYAYKGIYKGRVVEAVIGDLGDFLVKIGDGATGAYLMCNLTTDEPRPPLSFILPRNAKVELYGQFGEREALSMVDMVCENVNNTLVCTRPENATVERRLFNPYEVYYIVVDGYRLEPPLRIRCADPKHNNGLRAVYVEGFIPRLSFSKAQRVVLNEAMAQDIVKLARESGIDVTKPEELTVRGIYLTMASEQMVIPTLVLMHENTMILVGLHPSGPIFLGSAGLIGSPGAEEALLDSGLRLDWEDILSNMEYVKHTREEGVQVHLVVLGIVLVVTALAVALMIWIRR
jgi:hypothetical protein